jgi:hypothetical protein
LVRHSFPTRRSSDLHARYGKKRGALLGTVVRTGADWVELRLVAPVMAGDGVVFENPADTDREMGGRIFQLDLESVVFRSAGAGESGACDAGHAGF